MARPLAFICNLGVALVLLVAASAAQPQGVTSTTIVLGQSAPLSGATAYVCGSSGFCDAATDLVADAGVPVARIRVERFGPTG